MRRPSWPQQAGKATADSRRANATATTRGPRSPSQDTASGTSPTWPPASGCVVCTLYNTQPEDFSSCNPNQGDPLINPEGHRRGTCRRPARTQGWQAPRWLVSQDCSQDGTSQRDGDEGRQPPTQLVLVINRITRNNIQVYELIMMANNECLVVNT